jgi:hypothetical protein
MARLVRHHRHRQCSGWRITIRWLRGTNHSNVRSGYVHMQTCGSSRGIVGNRDPLGYAAGVRGAAIGRYDCQ